MNSIEQAKAIVSTVYSKGCTKKAMSSLCGRWDTRFHDGFRVSCGKFRSVIIPDNCNFVIKVGACRGGVEQCEREYQFYQEAVAEGLGHYFAKCYGKFYWHRHWFYVFERINDINEYRDDYEEVISRYTYDKIHPFLRAHHINDLHGGNYGKRGRSYVLTDYSGYYYSDNY